MNNDIICGCKQVTTTEIIESIKNGATFVAKVSEDTGAGTGCGRCETKLFEFVKANLS